MGREIKRVPLDFDWPLYQVWQGFLRPDKFDEQPCQACDGSGSSAHAKHLQDLWYGYIPFDPATTGSRRFTWATPAVRERAERNIDHSPQYYGADSHAAIREGNRLADIWNGMWCHHLDQADVDALVEAGRLHDFTHTWTKGEGWSPKDPVPAVSAAEVNLWSLAGFGHDAINCWIAVKARCEREGQPHICDACSGEGSFEKYDGQRAEAEAWEATEPPMGEGWQEWETTSEGSPISPVFRAPEELATWMSNPDRDDRYAKDWMPFSAAMQFIQAGWAPTFIGSPATGLVQGAKWVGMQSSDGAA